MDWIITVVSRTNGSSNGRALHIPTEGFTYNLLAIHLMHLNPSNGFGHDAVYLKKILFLALIT
jgi:hypothetical protein